MRKVGRLVKSANGIQVEIREKVRGGEIEEVVSGNEMRLAWIWVQGWRARLKSGGDLVERCRFAVDLE